MSGPKITAAELEAMRKREEEKRQLVQAIYREANALDRLDKTGSQLYVLLRPIYEEPGVEQLAEGILDIQRQIRQIRAGVSDCEHSQNEHLKEALSKLEGFKTRTAAALEQVRSESESIRERHFERALSQYKAPQSQAADGKKDAHARQCIADETKRLATALDMLEERAKAVNISTAEISKIRGRIAASVEDSDRPADMVYQELHRIDVFEFRPLRDRIEKMEAEADKLDAQLSLELAKYHTLCVEAGESPRKFPFSDASVNAIRYETGRLVDKLSNHTVDIPLMMQKVRQSLSEYGYEYIGEKCEKLQVYRELYRVHDNVVLHVVYDSEGHITMEVAVEDDCDRDPDAQETELLVQEQESFCEAFETIFALINERGLVLRKEHLYPCSPDFAEVINVAEFERAEAAYDATFDLYRDYHMKYLEEDAI